MKKWSEVIQSKEYRKLSPDERRQAQREYFDDVVAPQVPPEHVGAAREEFFADTDKSTGLGGARMTTPISEAQGPRPTDGMATGGKFFAGVGQGMVSAGRGLQNLTGFRPQEQVTEDRRLDADLLSSNAGQIGSMAGQAAMMVGPGMGMTKLSEVLPVIPGASAALGYAGRSMSMPTTVGQGMTGGAIAGLTQPAETLLERAGNTIVGAGVGGGIAGIGGVLNPGMRADVKSLIDQGVKPTTLGQLFGGATQRIEQGLTSVPVMGDMIKNRYRDATLSLNRAAMEKALNPVGETLPKGMEGREAVEYVANTLGAKYDALLPTLSAKIDLPFANEVASLRRAAATGLPKEQQEQFARIIDAELAKFQKTPGGTIASGDVLKGIEGNLRYKAQGYQRDQNFDTREMGIMLSDLLTSIREMTARSNPQAAQELKAINQGYANYKRVERAASSVAAEDGVFSAAQLHNAVKVKDPSKDKKGFATGSALMQDLSGPGKAVLGSKVPDSGTPFRSLTSLGPLGVPIAALGAIPAPLYSSLAQKAAVAVASQRPEVVRQLGKVTAEVAPYVTAAGVARSLNKGETQDEQPTLETPEASAAKGAVYLKALPPPGSKQWKSNEQALSIQAREQAPERLKRGDIQFFQKYLPYLRNYGMKDDDRQAWVDAINERIAANKVGGAIKNRRYELGPNGELVTGK